MIEIVRIGEDPNQARRVDELGVKAANLAEMTSLSLPVPPAFVLPIRFCAAIASGDPDAVRELPQALAEGIQFLEKAAGKKFGDRRRPLLVSVRSGAARSMPGMMDTVLNVGCSGPATRGLIRSTGNPRFAWDCRRRFLEAYAETILHLDPAAIQARQDQLLREEAATTDRDLDCETLQRLAADYEQLIGEADLRVEDDPMEQLALAVRAVCSSFAADRARTYRRLEGLEDLPGTSVTVQAMVFGNRGVNSGTGVAFSRNPSTGCAQPMIDVLFDAQGEDVVSGRRTPDTEDRIGYSLPVVAGELRDVLSRLERHCRDVQDVEFTIEEGRLWVLQTRTAKRTPRAALRIAIDLVQEGLISEEEAMRRLTGIDFATLAISRFVNPGEPAVHGVGAAGGVAVGRVALDSASAERLADCGDPVVLVRSDLITADVAGFAKSAAIVTATGGRTAHAALLARQKGKPCVTACDGLSIDSSLRRAILPGGVIEEGDWISVDGDSGSVYLGKREIVTEKPEQELAELDRWSSLARA